MKSSVLGYQGAAMEGRLVNSEYYNHGRKNRIPLQFKQCMEKLLLSNRRIQRKRRHKNRRIATVHTTRGCDRCIGVARNSMTPTPANDIPGTETPNWIFKPRKSNRQPLLQIQPRVIAFHCDNPDKEIHATLYLHNRARSKLTFKIKITNPYLFRVEPSTGFISSNKRVKVRVSLLEGVDVETERIQVLYSTIPTGAGAEPSSTEDSRTLWRDHTITERACQHKLSCRITGCYREKSKVLVVPNITITGREEKRHAPIPQQHESTTVVEMMESTEQCIILQQRRTEQSFSRTDNGTNFGSKSSVNINMNSNSKLQEWLLKVPTQQTRMVEQIYHELGQVHDTTQNLKPRVRHVAKAIEQVGRENITHAKEQSQLKHEIRKTKITAEQLQHEIKTPETVPEEDLQVTFMGEIELLTADVDQMVEEHELLWKSLENHEQKLKYYYQYLNINSNQPAHEWPQNSNQPTTEWPGEDHQCNKSTNAKSKHGNAGARRGSRGGADNKLKELEKTEHELRDRLTETAEKISALSRKSGNMADVLRDFSAELKTQRKDRAGDIDKLEMKYTQECALMPIRELTQHNQDMISNLHTSFLAHIENISKALDKLMIEHKEMRHFLNQQRGNFKRLKKAVCDVGKGIQDEHQHILQVVSMDNRRFNDLILIQATMHDRMKDIHIGLRNSMEKTQTLARRVGDFQRRLVDHKREMRYKLQKVQKKSVTKLNVKLEGMDEKFSEVTAKLDGVWEEMRLIRDLVANTERMLLNIANRQRQHKDSITTQMSTVEQRAGSQLESALQEARRHYDTLKAKIAGFQGTLKAMENLLKSASEKLQSLYNDLDRFKKNLTQEMKLLVKDIADAAEKHLDSISDVHKAVKKKIDEVLKGLTQIQKEAKTIYNQLGELEQSLEKRYKSVTSDIEKSGKEVHEHFQVRAQKSEIFHSKTDDDIANLNNELQGLIKTVRGLTSQMDELENKTSENVEEMRAMYDELTKRVNNFTTLILHEFYNKMQKAAEQLQDKLEHLSLHINSRVDRGVQQLARMRSNAARDQLAKLYLKAEHSDKIAEATRLRVDRNFYLLIMVLILLPLFMYSAFMNRNMQGPAHKLTTWWRSCCGQYSMRSKQV